jgi:AbiV family abortive infection protein
MRGHQFKGLLTPKQAAEGIKLANSNARDLYEDAEILYEKDRIERSVSLSILAIEEAGKSRILKEILLVEDPKELKKSWQEYRTHTAKNLAWIVPSLFVGGARTLDEFKTAFESTESHGQDIDNIKQLSFYTDIFGKGVWSHPKKAIDKKFARMILEFANILTKKSSISIESEKGLELWVKHMKPVWKEQKMSEMKEALIECYEEAESEGIINKGKANEMREFTF